MFINFKCSQTHPPSTYLSKSKQARLQIKNLSFNKLKTYLIVLSNSNELNKKKKIKFSQIYEEEEQGLTSLIHFAAHNTLELDLARCNDIHPPPPAIECQSLAEFRGGGVRKGWTGWIGRNDRASRNLMEYRIPLNKRQLDVSIRYNFRNSGFKFGARRREGVGMEGRVDGIYHPGIGENERNTATGV